MLGLVRSGTTSMLGLVRSGTESMSVRSGAETVTAMVGTLQGICITLISLMSSVSTVSLHFLTCAAILGVGVH